MLLLLPGIISAVVLTWWCFVGFVLLCDILIHFLDVSPILRKLLYSVKPQLFYLKFVKSLKIRQMMGGFRCPLLR